MPLLILFILIPVIEIALFIQIGGLIGLWPTIGLILLSAVVGMVLIRSQGRRALGELQESFRKLNDPTRPLAHGAMILFAGALMLTPGFFTDSIGLLLLVPWVRDRVMQAAARRVHVTRSGFGFDTSSQPRHGWPGKSGDVIDGDYSTQDDPYATRPDTELPPVDRSASPKRSKPSGWTRPE
ncbi:UPF0716 protein FxsA [Paracoccus isoporae]|uniref:UPF0716 protein FxsA n=1 Tax=Paracoccus isoporae TaxID=591205 RepID=A0A1G6UWN5_9RHOB|nr:FxsA family protein [Paracoccus isoporae]SDD45057.1 UPF0716 protein FxsA [Paracoccus isoporae]